MRPILKILLLLILNLNIYSFEKPDWTNGYVTEKEYKFYGVGSAKKHINGKNEQKKLALKRAIDEVAIQKESTIESNLDVYRVNEKTYVQESSSQTID
ncbi:MAG: hypothetical protein ACRC34_02935, partial [Cetobacterium sp.]